jgi:hypothetical protein
LTTIHTRDRLWLDFYSIVGKINPSEGKERACSLAQLLFLGTTTPKKMAKANTKVVLQRRDKFLTAWREHAPDATFATTSLVEFEAQTTNLDLLIQQMKGAQSKLDGLMLDRDKAVQELNETMLLIAHGIRGTPQYGEDCSLHRALGFVPKSERRTGLKRNTQSPPEDAGAV